MKILKQTSLIILIGIIISCTGKSVKKEVVVEKPYKYASMKDSILHLDLLNSKKDSSVLKLSQIADSLIYIPLETKKECMLKNYINELYIDGDNIFIQDGWYVYNYDISGKFKRQIGKVGRGIGECICTGMTVDKNLKRIYINANYKRRLFVYDYDGKFISNKARTRRRQQDVYFCNGDNVLYNTSSYVFFLVEKDRTKYNPINIFNTKGKLLKSYKSKYFPDNFFVGGIGDRIVVSGAVKYEYKDKMYFQEIANDTLYCVNKDTIIPRLVLNSSACQKVPFNSERYHADPKVGMWWFTSGYKYFPARVTGESDRFIFLDGVAKPSYIYDKEERTVFCSEEYVEWVEGDKPGEKKAERYTYMNDMDGVNHMSSDMVINNKYIVRVIDAVDFLSNVDKLKSEKNVDSKYLARLEEIAKSLEEESNPVMILAKLKK